jgi:hypothetical protein
LGAEPEKRLDASECSYTHPQVNYNKVGIGSEIDSAQVNHRFHDSSLLLNEIAGMKKPYPCPPDRCVSGVKPLHATKEDGVNRPLTNPSKTLREARVALQMMENTNSLLIVV